MPSPEPRSARVVISIDIDPAREDSFLCTDLLDTLAGHRAPALWCLGFRRHAPVLDRIRATASPSEFGILATREWADRRCARNGFAQELALRSACAARAGVKLRAMALQAIDPPRHLDLIARHRIALLRTRTDQPGASLAHRPSLARFGLGQADPTLVIPATSRWSLFWSAPRLFKRAVTTGETIHLVASTEELARNPPGGLAALDYLLRMATTRRDLGELQMVLPSQLLPAHVERSGPVASRSVLRAA